MSPSEKEATQKGKNLLRGSKFFPFRVVLYNRVFNCFKQHVYYVSINSFIYYVSKNNFLECSTCLQ